MHPDIAEALRSRRRGVVALETTIVTHGLPWPTNLETAKTLERVVREGGAVPATIAVMDGRVRVGLTDLELERVAEAGAAGRAVKCSKRDVAAVAALSYKDPGVVGATTVAATLSICKLAGISVFATGGIGGVHFEGEDSMDVSADLIELGRCPVAVVCAGCKSVLDVPRTLEVLETNGVAVLGYGTDKFPTFFTVSDYPTPHKVDGPAGVARWLEATKALDLEAGAVVAVPYSGKDQEQFDKAAQQAIQEQPAELHGAEATPWLLTRVAELTEGKSIEANVELVVNNARVATDVARAAAPRLLAPAVVAVLGSTSLDVVSRVNGPNVCHHGGVARNVAEAAARSGADVAFVSAATTSVQTYLTDQGVDCSNCATVGGANFASVRLPSYVACYDAVGNNVHENFDDGGPGYGARLLDSIKAFFSGESGLAKKRVVLLDADIPDEGFSVVLDRLKPADVLWLDPTDPKKAVRFLPLLQRASLVAPNEAELRALFTALVPDAKDPRADVFTMAVEVAKTADVTLVVTRGLDGVLFVTPDGHTSTFSPYKVFDVVPPNSAVGAGDTLIGVAAAAWLRLFDADPNLLPLAVQLGMRAAELTVQSPATVHPTISPLWLEDAAVSICSGPDAAALLLESTDSNHLHNTDLF